MPDTLAIVDPPFIWLGGGGALLDIRLGPLLSRLVKWTDRMCFKAHNHRFSVFFNSVVECMLAQTIVMWLLVLATEPGTHLEGLGG